MQGRSWLRDPSRAGAPVYLCDRLRAGAGWLRPGANCARMLLSALASCIAHTFLIVGADRGIAYEALEVEVQAVIDFRGVLEVEPGIDPMPTNIRYEARVSSVANAETLAAVQTDVERLCPVLQAFVRPLQVVGTVVRQ